MTRYAWMVNGNHQLMLVALPDPPMPWWRRLGRWVRRMMTIVYLVVIVVTVAGCIDGLDHRQGHGVQYGPTWPHAVCDTVDTCWPVPDK